MAGVPLKSARIVSIALGSGRGVAAWWPSGGGPTEAHTLAFTFDADALAAGDFRALDEALAALRRAVGHGSLAVHVALASPWTSPRVVAMPPVRDDEARAVLERDAARHFPALRAEPVMGVRAIARTRGAPGAWLAADADGVVLDAIARAVRGAAWSLARVTSAVGAWAHASGEASGRVFVVGDEATVIHARRGLVERLRRCRVVDLGVAVSGAAEGLEIAARHAPWSAEGELVHPSVRAARRDVTVRIARQLVTAGVGALVLAAALQWWGVRREATLLAADRAALRPSIVGVLAQRDSLTALDDAIGALARADRDAPRWSERLWALSAALPADAWFTSVRGAGDSVQVEGRAVSAAPVFEALRGARGVESVRATAPITVNDGTGGTREAFSVVVRFGASPGTAP